MSKRIKIKWNDEYECYDLVIKNTEANVADFETVCEDVFSGVKAKRRYGDACIGCSICCSERIPVTLVDMQRLYGYAVKKEGKREKDFRRWLESCLSVVRYGEMIDVTLQVNEFGICRYWVAEEGICSVYECRPFACRTYICSPVSRRMEKLRSRIINKGQDRLVVFLYGDIDEEYRRNNPFFGAWNYGDIRLREICSKRLWQQLKE